MPALPSHLLALGSDLPEGPADSFAYPRSHWLERDYRADRSESDDCSFHGCLRPVVKASSLHLRLMNEDLATGAIILGRDRAFREAPLENLESTLPLCGRFRRR